MCDRRDELGNFDLEMWAAFRWFRERVSESRADEKESRARLPDLRKEVSEFSGRLFESGEGCGKFRREILNARRETLNARREILKARREILNARGKICGTRRRTKLLCRDSAVCYTLIEFDPHASQSRGRWNSAPRKIIHTSSGSALRSWKIRRSGYGKKVLVGFRHGGPVHSGAEF